MIRLQLKILRALVGRRRLEEDLELVHAALVATEVKSGRPMRSAIAAWSPLAANVILAVFAWSILSAMKAETSAAVEASNAIASRAVERLDTALRFTDTYVREINIHREALGLDPIPNPSHAHLRGP